jgi:DNA-binding transcriptional regulator YdaS (Cro superfamily)
MEKIMAQMQSEEKVLYPRLRLSLLKALGTRYSQQWLADHMNVSPAAVNQWVNGRTRPTPAHLGQIAALLDLIPHDLADDADYDDYDDPIAYDKVLAAYKIWRSVQEGIGKVYLASKQPFTGISGP